MAGIALFSVLCPSIMHAQCNVDFSWTYGGGTTFNFHDESSFDSIIPPTLYFWDFGDGTSANSSDPVHTYASPGVYLVCLQVYNGNYGPFCCSDSICKYVSTGKGTGVVTPSGMAGTEVYLSSSGSAPLLIIDDCFGGNATLTVFDAQGAIAIMPYTLRLLRGRNEMALQRDLPLGIYIIQLKQDKEVISKKVCW